MSRRRNPFEDIEEMFDRMSSRFEEGGLSDFRDVDVDVSESEEELTIHADLPGYDKEDIDISIRDNRLTIEAVREREEEEEDEEYHRRERTHRAVSRTVRLPAEVDKEAATATYEDGVLTVTLPKTEPAESGRTIDIE